MQQGSPDKRRQMTASPALPGLIEARWPFPVRAKFASRARSDCKYCKRIALLQAPARCLGQVSTILASPCASVDYDELSWVVRFRFRPRRHATCIRCPSVIERAPWRPSGFRTRETRPSGPLRKGLHPTSKDPSQIPRRSRLDLWSGRLLVFLGE